ncbi:MAG: nuclear transport factor 2 family protein [Capsulimonadales bacterium]|nr:nuclear transport factor 2 family protein [Capsulimonadales bacterium]
MSNVRLHELLEYIGQGRILEAMKEFYAEDVVMEEPRYGTTVGLAANIAREEQFLAFVKEWKSFSVPNLVVGENVSFYENALDFVGADGNDYHMEQVAVQTWENGKIVRERFYYNAA